MLALSLTFLDILVMLLVASKLVSSMLLKSVKILTIFSILADSSVKFDVISDTDFEIFSA